MKQFRNFFAVFLTLLISVPLIDKTIDEWSHLQELHCADSSTHFCKAEHHCPVCDYVVAFSSVLPVSPELQPLFLSTSYSYQTPKPFAIYCSEQVLIKLRGPPQC